MIYIEPLVEESGALLACSSLSAPGFNFAAVSTIIRAPTSELYGIYLSEGLTGRIGEVRLIRDRCYSFSDFRIADGFRGMGYGKATLICILEHFRSEGRFRKVRIHVNAGNEVALNLYERCGFVITGSFGLERNVFVMERSV